MEQYKNFISLENFKLAFVRLKTAQKNLYKTIYYPDIKIFEIFLDENLESLINQIENKTYIPEKSHKIFIPKKNELVRPLSMLKLTDLIVYQALVNIIADEAFDKIAPRYSNTVFGNIVNTSASNEIDKKFFYQPWKRSWKNFSLKSKQYLDEGYKYISEFDIASFFDTIDHSILIQILENEYKIEKKITSLLSSCLQSWTADFNHRTFSSHHGIPQGPLSSPFLADLYLMYLDDEIIVKSKLDIKYVRYVDDIRIFTRDTKVSRRAIAALDLISRDLGLIPQGNKIATREITDIEKELKLQNDSFSKINKEFSKITDGKLSKGLTSKTHKKLKERFLNCFIIDDDDRKEIYLDKTVISFALYKLNKDDDVKDLLIKNYEVILTHFEGVIFYLRKYYFGIPEILSFIKSVLNDDEILFHHLVANIFQIYPEIEFDEALFERYVNNKNRNWLVRYFMVDWLHHNGKSSLFELLISENDGNYFIQRKINNYKFIVTEDRTFRKMFSVNLMKSKDDLISLQGLYLSFRNLSIFLRITTHKDHNQFVRRIVNGEAEDYIVTTLKNDYLITNPESFFNKDVWPDIKIYNELKENLFSYNRFKLSDPSIAILSLNNFNNICFDKISERLGITYDAKEYGVKIDSKKLERDFPNLTRYWAEINSKRNQQSEAHPYDKYGNVRVKINSEQLSIIHPKQIEVLREVCNYNGY